MNSAIKILEEIGQNTSLNQHKNLIEMLKSLDVKEDTFNKIDPKTKEFVCLLFPEDDDKEEDKEDNKEEEIVE